jgi:hypothetical protein
MQAHLCHTPTHQHQRGATQVINEESGLHREAIPRILHRGKTMLQSLYRGRIVIVTLQQTMRPCCVSWVSVTIDVHGPFDPVVVYSSALHCVFVCVCVSIASINSPRPHINPIAQSRKRTTRSRMHRRIPGSTWTSAQRPDFSFPGLKRVVGRPIVFAPRLNRMSSRNAEQRRVKCAVAPWYVCDRCVPHSDSCRIPHIHMRRLQKLRHGVHGYCIPPVCRPPPSLQHEAVGNGHPQHASHSCQTSTHTRCMHEKRRRGQALSRGRRRAEQRAGTPSGRWRSAKRRGGSVGRQCEDKSPSGPLPRLLPAKKRLGGPNRPC